MPAAAIEKVDPVIAFESIVPGATVDEVWVYAAIDGVVTVTAEQAVVAPRTPQRVVSAASMDLVSSGPGVNRVRYFVPDDQVLTLPSVGVLDTREAETFRPRPANQALAYATL